MPTWQSGELDPLTYEPIQFDFLFTGHLYHAKSGLYFAPFRAYNPEIGRWISRDPIDVAGGINLYEYVGGDPVNWVDVFGRERKPGKTPNGRWPQPPKPLKCDKWSWNPDGYYDGPGGKRYHWDDRSHGTGHRGNEGHWDEEATGERFREDGSNLTEPEPEPESKPKPEGPPVPFVPVNPPRAVGPKIIPSGSGAGTCSGGSLGRGRGIGGSGGGGLHILRYSIN